MKLQLAFLGHTCTGLNKEISLQLMKCMQTNELLHLTDEQKTSPQKGSSQLIQ